MQFSFECLLWPAILSPHFPDFSSLLLLPCWHRFSSERRVTSSSPHEKQTKGRAAYFSWRRARKLETGGPCVTFYAREHDCHTYVNEYGSEVCSSLYRTGRVLGSNLGTKPDYPENICIVLVSTSNSGNCMFRYTTFISFRFLSFSKITTQLVDTKIEALCETSLNWVMPKKTHTCLQQLPLFDSVSPEKVWLKTCTIHPPVYIAH
jgi:hypothetical protein